MESERPDSTPPQSETNPPSETDRAEAVETAGIPDPSPEHDDPAADVERNENGVEQGELVQPTTEEIEEVSGILRQNASPAAMKVAAILDNAAESQREDETTSEEPAGMGSEDAPGDGPETPAPGESGVEDGATTPR